MDKKKFEENIVPLTPKEQLYQEDEKLAGSYFDAKHFAAGDTITLSTPKDMHGSIMAQQEKDIFFSADIFFNKQTRFSQVPLHHHDYIEMNYVYSGHCTAIINGKTVEMQQGEVCIMDCGVVHTILPTGENDILLNCGMSQRYFTASFVERLSASGAIPRFLASAMSDEKDHNRYLLISTAKSPMFHDLIEDVFCEYLHPQVCAEGAISNYMNLIFIELIRCYQGEMESEYRQNRRNYITEVLRYMEDNCVTCTLKETSARFGFNEKYLSRLIHSATGKNFKELITDGRLSRAAFLLVSTEQSVQDIAQQCGYSNLSFFYKKFQERYESTPAEYREKTKRL